MPGSSFWRLPALGDIAQCWMALARRRYTKRNAAAQCSGIVARYILPPLWCAFSGTPAISIEIVAEDFYSDVFAKGFDAGVRYDERLELDMIAVPLGPRSQRFIAVASPDYLKTHGTPSHPEDLLKHKCIRHRFLSGVMPTWEFEREGVVVRVDPPSVMITNSLDISRAAAVAGLGIMSSFSEFTEAEVASGACGRYLRTGWAILRTLYIIPAASTCRRPCGRFWILSKPKK
jgi:DNA-binding transcriptional LysR family regulator